MIDLSSSIYLEYQFYSLMKFERVHFLPLIKRAVGLIQAYTEFLHKVNFPEARMLESTLHFFFVFWCSCGIVK